MTPFSLIILLAVFAFVILIIILKNTIIIVRGREIAVVERKYFGQRLAQGRVIAMANQVGVQARTLGPGMHFLIPFLYKTKKFPFMEILEDEVGLIESIDGNPVPPGKIFAKVVEGHNAFQDGESFLLNGGEKGPQIGILPPGNYRINPFLFKVNKIKYFIVDKGQIGLITAMDGEAINPGRLLAQKAEGHVNFQNGETFLDNHGQKGPQAEILLPGTYRINTALFNVQIEAATVIPSGSVGLVTARDGEALPETEYVAKSVTGHTDFQNVDAFLKNHGQRGPQLDVLKPGTYYINPLMFQIELDKVAVIERGQVAVVVSNIGKEPEEIAKLVDQEKQVIKDDVQPADVISGTENRLSPGLERYVVPKGYRGIQQEVAGPGIYYLNRRAFMVYVIDTTNITVDWDDGKDTKFDPLKVVSRDGFEINVAVKVIMRVRPDQAPYMVAKIGSIDNLISHVVHPMIDSSFRNQASSTSAMNFLQDRQDEQKKAEERTRLELEKYHVECVSVLICQIKLPQELMDTQTMKIIAQQKTTMFEEQRKAEVSRINMEKTKATAEKQPELVQAEINVSIAEQVKMKMIKEAEGQGEAIKIKATGEAAGIKVTGDAEASKILAIGTSTAEAYRKQNEAITAEGVIAIEVAKKIAEGNIKVTPDFLVQGNDGLSGLLSAYLLKNVSQKDKVITK